MKTKNNDTIKMNFHQPSTSCLGTLYTGKFEPAHKTISFACSSHKPKLSHRFTCITTEFRKCDDEYDERYDVDEYMMNVSFCIFIENKTMGKRE